MNPVIIREDSDPRIIELLKSLTRDVFSLVKTLSRGDFTLDEFNNQEVDFDNDVVLGIIPRDDLTSFLITYQTDPRITEIKELLGAGGKKVEFRNFYYYPPDTMMTWHTNSNAIGTRVYYSLISGGDIFRYRDPYTKEIIDIMGKDGWNVKEFQIGNTPENRLWHTIYAIGPRFSFGFNILDD